jgi:hypothetical protein
MYLAPTLVPDIESGWMQIMPCSYAISSGEGVPPLGSMKEGAALSDFWNVLDRAMRTHETIDQASNIQITLARPINPSRDCPQCRYYMFNKRVIAIKEKSQHWGLIARLVDELEQDPSKLDARLVSDITSTWETWVVNIELAQQAFSLAKKFKLRPTL